MKLYTSLLAAVCLTLFGCGDSTAPKEQSSTEKVVEDAYRLCTALERTGLTSECEVKGWGMTVDARIDTSGPGAIKICEETAGMMSKHTNSFKGRWKFRIFSPFSGDHPLAVCTLW